MRALKKRNMVRTTFCLATLLLSLAAVAPAQIGGTCSTGSVAGAWGYTELGTLVLPTGAVPFAAVGTGTLDADGNFSGVQNSSTGGSVGPNMVKGTATVNPDCTGTMKVGIYDPAGINLLRTAVFAVVYVDHASEMQGIVTSLIVPPGTSVPPVLTLDAKRLFPAR